MNRAAPVLLGLLLSAVGSVSSCGIPCECPTPELIELPDSGSYVLSAITGENLFDGGDSFEWSWEDVGNPFDDLFDGTAVWEDRTLTLTYTTASGTWRATFEEG